jgi:hypothetical protein
MSNTYLRHCVAVARLRAKGRLRRKKNLFRLWQPGNSMVRLLRSNLADRLSGEMLAASEW